MKRGGETHGRFPAAWLLFRLMRRNSHLFR
jgi:hypothetical protein